jgi:tetratricopeptide (TPR) repeat protein
MSMSGRACTIRVCLYILASVSIALVLFGHVAASDRGSKASIGSRGYSLADFEARYGSAIAGYSLGEAAGELKLLLPNGAARERKNDRLQGAHPSVQLVYTMFQLDALPAALMDTALEDVVRADSSDGRLEWLDPAIALVEDMARRARDPAMLDELLQRNPEGGVENAIVAYRYALARNQKDAAAHVERSMSSASSDETTFRFLGTIYSVLGESRLEEEVYLKGLKRFPESDDLRAALASVYGELAEWDKAYEIYRILLERNPSNAEYQMHLRGLEKLIEHERKKAPQQ